MPPCHAPGPRSPLEPETDQFDLSATAIRSRGEFAPSEADRLVAAIGASAPRRRRPAMPSNSFGPLLSAKSLASTRAAGPRRSFVTAATTVVREHQRARGDPHARHQRFPLQRGSADAPRDGGTQRSRSGRPPEALPGYRRNRELEDGHRCTIPCDDRCAPTPTRSGVDRAEEGPRKYFEEQAKSGRVRAQGIEQMSDDSPTASKRISRDEAQMPLQIGRSGLDRLGIVHAESETVPPGQPEVRHRLCPTACALIEAFGPDNRSMTVADVAARTGHDRAVVRRL